MKAQLPARIGVGYSLKQAHLARNLQLRCVGLDHECARHGRDMAPATRQLGLRRSFKRPHLAPALTEGRLNWLWKEVGKAGVPIVVAVSHATVHLTDRVAERYPGLKLAMNHLTLTIGEKNEEAVRDLDKLLAIVRRPNVAVKASALPAYITRPRVPP